MKLVQILAKELKEWPEADSEYGPIESMSQADDLQVSHYSGVRQVWREDVHDWSSHDYVPFSRFTLPELATDHATAIVIRADWEAEKARIAGKVDGGWKRHKGVKQSVADGVKVEIRTRGGDFEVCSADGFAWGATGNSQIMAYRIHKPAEQPAIEPAVVENVQAFNAQAELLYDPVAQGPLQWRDRIYELDTQRAELEATYQRQIGEIDGERLELVGKLKAEGLALVEVVQPVEDMSDWRNWKAGDFLECVDISDKHCAAIQLGELYQYKGFGDVIDDDGDEQAYPVKHGKCFKWHSRPGK